MSSQHQHTVQDLCATDLASRYQSIRGFTDLLCSSLSAEDMVIQSMPDVSPTRWHLAHTTWFFETFVLARHSGFKPFKTEFGYLFNSYYNTVGDQYPRSQRGLLSRPGLHEIQDYRRAVDQQIDQLLLTESLSDEVLRILELGLHHEQQHQELLLTDIKHVLSCNPSMPVYRDGSLQPSNPEPQDWLTHQEGLEWIGFEGDSFSYDNESPRHRTFLESFSFSNRLVTCGEFKEFMEDDGYKRPELWLSLGWNAVQEQGWNSPLYWVRHHNTWHQFTLGGLCPLDLLQPVCHISYFEADAFARWAEARLPTEAEWEVMAKDTSPNGNFADPLMDEGDIIHPTGTTRHIADQGSDRDHTSPTQMFGDVWEWTSSPYTAYPGYAPPNGALGEYNGKFMCNQFVLRGGSCATSQDHIRATYRNFFPPDARWQFSGIRLARDTCSK